MPGIENGGPPNFLQDPDNFQLSPIFSLNLSWFYFDPQNGILIISRAEGNLPQDGRWIEIEWKFFLVTVSLADSLTLKDSQVYH